MVYLLFVVLFVYWIFDSYNRIDTIITTKYRVNLSAYEKRLQDIYKTLKGSSNYIRDVVGVEVEDEDDISVTLGVRKEIFYITDGNKICSVSDDNRIMEESKSIRSLPVFFYPYVVSCKIMAGIDDRLFKYYETITSNMKVLLNLRKIKVFYIKPSYDVLHIYFWIDNNVKFYAGYFLSVTRDMLRGIDRRLGAVLLKLENLKDFQLSEVDLSFRKVIVKLH